VPFLPNLMIFANLASRVRWLVTGRSNGLRPDLYNSILALYPSAFNFKALLSLHGMIVSLLSPRPIYSEAAFLKGLHHKRRHLAEKCRRHSRMQWVFKCKGKIERNESRSGVRGMAVRGYGVPGVTMKRRIVGRMRGG
jgi:hypothetical protein